MARIANVAAIDMLQALIDQIETGTTAELRVYTGSQPADCETGNGANTLLGTMNFSGGAGAFPAPSDGGGKATVNAASIADDTSADDTGTIGYWRIYNGAGTCIMQGSATVTGGGGDAEFNTLSVTTGDTISCTGLTLDMPEV